MIDITKQRTPEGVNPSRKKIPAPTNTTTTVTRIMRETGAPGAPALAPEAAPFSPAYQAGVAAMHGPGGARDPFAEENAAEQRRLDEGVASAQSAYTEYANWARENAASVADDDRSLGLLEDTLSRAQAERAAFGPKYAPAEAAPIEGSPEAARAAMDESGNITRVPLTPEQQAEMTQFAVQEAAAVVADRRAQDLAVAGLDESKLAALVRLNPNKTEEEILAISLRGKKAVDYVSDVGHAIFDRFGTRIHEAATGRGEGISAFIGGPAEMDSEVPILGGLERVGKVLEATAMPIVEAPLALFSYATAEAAQNAIIASPVDQRFAQKMKDLGYDPFSADHPNERLAIIDETLMEAAQFGTPVEQLYAQSIMKTKGYVEFVAGGGAHMTSAGLALLRNAARRSAAAVAYRQANAALNKSGGLERRMGAQGGVEGGVSQRILAVAAASNDAATITRMSALATKIANREAVAATRLEAERLVNKDSFISDVSKDYTKMPERAATDAADAAAGRVPKGGDVSTTTTRTNSQGVSARLTNAMKSNKMLSEETGGGMRLETGPEGVRAGKVVIGKGKEQLPGGSIAGSRSGGYFEEKSGDFVITPDHMVGGIAGKRHFASTVVHEIVHVGQWLSTGRNLEKFAAMDDLERLPSQVQEVVLRLMGVSDEAMSSAEAAVRFKQQGVRGQVVDAIRKWAEEDGAGQVGQLKKGRTTLYRYADSHLQDRLLRRLNRTQETRRRGNGPVTQEERDLIDKIIAMKDGNKDVVADVTARKSELIGADEAAGPSAGPAEATPENISRRDSGEHADEVYRLTTQDPDNIGATYSLRKGDMSGEDAWAVGAYPERAVKIEGRDVTPGDIQQFIAKNEDLLKRNDLSIGTYKDPDTGITTLDIVKTPNAEQFMAHTVGTRKGELGIGRVDDAEVQLKNSRAAARKQAIQIAKDSIYNLRTGKVVKTPKAKPYASDVSSIVNRIRSHGTPELFTKAAKWYTNAREFARAMSDEADFAPSTVPLRKVASAMAALSSQNEWSGIGKMDNLKSLYKILRAFERGDKDPFAIEEGLNLSGGQVSKAWRALNSKGDPLDELVGAKERAFALDIIGEKDLAVVDRHVGKGGFGLRDYEKPTAAEHARVQAAYEKALVELKAEGIVPDDFMIRDLQAADWGILGQKELDFWTAQADQGTMFPGTPPENLPYRVSEGVGEIEPLAAPGEITPSRGTMGGLSSKAFGKYKDIGTLVRTIQESSGGKYKGIKDFNEAIKRGEIEGMPEPLVKDFLYGNIERELAYRGLPDDEIKKIVDETLERIKGNCG